MEETLLLPMEMIATQDAFSEPSEAGSLEVSGDTYTLIQGCNVIARRSRNTTSHATRTAKFQSTYSQFDHVASIYLPGETLSSEHAMICMELIRDQKGSKEIVAFIEDLKSRNKTKVKPQGPFVPADPALTPGARTRISSGSAVLFGGVEGVVTCRQLAPEADRSSPAAMQDDDETLDLDVVEADAGAAVVDSVNPAAATAACLEEPPQADASPSADAQATGAASLQPSSALLGDAAAAAHASGTGKPADAATAAALAPGNPALAPTQAQHSGAVQLGLGDPAAVQLQPSGSSGQDNAAAEDNQQPALSTGHGHPAAVAAAETRAAALAFLEGRDHDDAHISSPPGAAGVNVPMTLGHDDADDVWPPLERPPSPRATAGGAEGASPTGAAAAAAVGNAADGVAATLSSLLPAAEGRKEQQAASAQLPQPGAAAASDTTTGGAVAASNAAGDEVRSAAADGVGTVPPEAAARSPADSEETRDSQDGAPGEVCTPVAPAVQHMAADGSGATWRHIKRKSATDPAASTEQPNAAAALPAVLPGEEVPPAAETQQDSPLVSPSAIQTALDGAGAAAALFPATQAPQDVTTVTPEAQPETPADAAAEPAGAPVQGGTATCSGGSSSSREAAQGAGQPRAAAGDAAPAWGTEAAAGMLAPQPDADAAAAQQTLAGGSPRHGKQTLAAADDLANLSTASPDSPPAEEEAAPSKHASTAKPRPAAGNKAAAPPAVDSDAARLKTPSARPGALSRSAAKEEPTQPPAVVVQPTREESPVPAPGLRDPARRRKAIRVKSASAEAEAVAIAPTRSRTPAEARVPRDGGRIASRASRRSRSSPRDSPAHDASAEPGAAPAGRATPPPATLPAAASRRKRKAAESPPPRQPSREASPDGAAPHQPAARPSKRGRSRLADASIAAPEGTPNADGEATRGAAQRHSTRKSKGTPAAATPAPESGGRRAIPAAHALRTRRTPTPVQLARAVAPAAGDEQVKASRKLSEPASAKAAKQLAKRTPPVSAAKPGRAQTAAAKASAQCRSAGRSGLRPTAMDKPDTTALTLSPAPRSPDSPEPADGLSGLAARTAGKRGRRSRAAQEVSGQDAVEGVTPEPAGKRRKKAQQAEPASNAAAAPGPQESPTAPPSAQAAGKRRRRVEASAHAPVGAAEPHRQVKRQPRAKAVSAKKGPRTATATSGSGKTAGGPTIATPDAATAALGRRKGGPDVIVRFGKSVGMALRTAQAAIVEQLGGRVTEDDEDFTHLVVQPRANKQDTTAGFVKSFTSLMALAAGRPIVDLGWVRAAGDAKAFSSPLANASSFLLNDKVAEKEHGFSAVKSYEAARARLLLQDRDILITPALRSEEKDGGKGLQALVEAAGGRVVHDDQDLSAESGCLVIGSSMKARQSEQSQLRGKVPPGTLLYGRAQLLDAILKQDHSFGRSGEIAVLG